MTNTIDSISTDCDTASTNTVSASSASASSANSSTPIYRVQNPVTNEITETFDFITDTDLQTAITQADQSFHAWSNTAISERRQALHKVADLFDERAEELAKIAATEMGKPPKEGIGEVRFVSSIFRYYADNGADFIENEPLSRAEGPATDDTVLRRLPIGALLGIMPWNYPYYQIARFAAPNLMLGNTVLLKGAEICPRSALAVQAIMDDAGIEAGVYTNIFANHGQVADVIADPRIQGVSLTGSERAGAAVAALAGQNLKKVVLELGGSDPYIILDTDDVQAAARQAWRIRMSNNGQACNSNKRMIVMEDIYEEFVAELVNQAKQMKPGTPEEADDRDVYQPLSSRAAAETLHQQVHTAVKEGATLHAGGTLSDIGAYFSPAVLTDVRPGTKAYAEELFGPVAVVYKVSSDEEAVRLANDSQFGLGGSVFATDQARAEAVAQQLQVGMTNVNTYAASGAELPFGGVKRSGFGRELGPLAMDEFANKQLLYVKRR